MEHISEDFPGGSLLTESEENCIGNCIQTLDPSVFGFHASQRVFMRSGERNGSGSAKSARMEQNERRRFV